MQLDHLEKMRQCRHLLPAPAPEVVEELIVEVLKLRKCLEGSLGALKMLDLKPMNCQAYISDIEKVLS